jgi:hypothetical protein
MWVSSIIFISCVTNKSDFFTLHMNAFELFDYLLLTHCPTDFTGRKEDAPRLSLKETVSPI